MNRRSLVHTLAGAAVVAAAVLSTPAHATGAAAEGSAAACDLDAGSVTATGAHGHTGITAGTPPTMTHRGETEGVYQPGQVRLSTTFVDEPNMSGDDMSGWVVQGDSVYLSYYSTSKYFPPTFKRIGGGWTNFTALEVSRYDEGPDGTRWDTAYGLRNDGTLFRWNVTSGTWRSTGSAAGFAAVKSMALISKTKYYDTFLANTRGGALYTIRIPTTSPMKPIVKQVRSSTWQGFENLIAGKCGQYGTLLVGIDTDGKAGYVYAVGHANGTSTVINALGKVEGTFPDPVYFRWGVAPYLDPLNGD